jgi:hypothetical protein
MTDAASNLCKTPGISSGGELEGSTMKQHLTFLIRFLESEYATTLEEARNLVQHGEITFALLWAIFVPGEVILARCRTTGEPRAFRLRKIEKKCRPFTSEFYWHLTSEYVEGADDPSAAGEQFGLASYAMEIEDFDGVQKIAELTAFPIKYHANAIDIGQKLMHRGRKWVKLFGIHHKQYSGLAYWNRRPGPAWVNGRIMIDRRKHFILYYRTYLSM